MTEWTIVTVISVLVELLVTVTLPMIKLTNKLTSLDERLTNNEKRVTDVEEDFEKYKESPKQSQKNSGMLSKKTKTKYKISKKRFLFINKENKGGNKLHQTRSSGCSSGTVYHRCWI